MDVCSMCGHAWHGLICEHKDTRLDEHYRYSVTEKCKCPGPFKPPALQEDNRNTSKKGYW